MTGTVDTFVVDRAGRVIAWSTPGCRSCASRVGVMHLPSRSVVQVGGRGFNMHPTLSPDGREVAFERFTSLWGDNGIWVASTSDGHLRRLTRRGVCANWSPDGRWILYADIPGPGVLGRLAYSARLISPDGRSTRLLARGATQMVPCERGQAWSLDSKSVAMVDGNGRLFTLHPPGTHRTILTGFSVGRVGRYAWSPDSRTLVLSANTRPGWRHCAMWAVRADGSSTRRLGGCR